MKKIMEFLISRKTEPFFVKLSRVYKRRLRQPPLTNLQKTLKGGLRFENPKTLNYLWKTNLIVKLIQDFMLSCKAILGQVFSCKAILGINF